MSQDHLTNSSLSLFKWMDIHNVSKQIYSGHNRTILFSLKITSFIYLSMWQPVQEYDSMQIQVTFHISLPIYLFHPPWCYMSAWWPQFSVDGLMVFVYNSTRSYSFSFPWKKCCLVNDLPEKKFYILPKENF